MSEAKFVYEIDIKATADIVWRSLTTAEFTSQYFHATHVESTWQPGADVLYRYDRDGDIAVEGKVIEINRPHLLVISWHVLYDEIGRGEAPSRVTFQIDQIGAYSRLRVIHDRFPDNSIVYAGICKGWPEILTSLKLLLESDLNVSVARE
jgi:uncharacterized protein YndB with AHSA1/START domain